MIYEGLSERGHNYKHSNLHIIQNMATKNIYRDWLSANKLAMADDTPITEEYRKWHIKYNKRDIFIIYALS